LQAQAPPIPIIFSHGRVILLSYSKLSLISAISFTIFYYFYSQLIHRFTTGQDTTLRSLIDLYFSAQQALQQVSNPSGTVTTGGLAEPKFNINGTAFTGPWGR
jgi:hypothetical protein